MVIEKCVKCGFPKHGLRGGAIWLSKDGYCSVCNHQFKDRKRKIDGMDKFITTKTIKESNYNHLNRHGRKFSNANALYERTMKTKQSNSGLEWKKVKEKGIKKLDDFL